MSLVQLQGQLEKMAIRAAADGSAGYELVLGNTRTGLNDLLGQMVQLDYQGAIHCCACGRRTKTSFGQGYCYPCFTRLAQCDSCMMSPEKCHFHLGTCREPDWAEQVCFNEHIVYLANSSGLKVGITRATQMPIRWLDQGAVQALPIARVATRRLSGLLEDLFRRQVADKTNWRALLKGDAPLLNLAAERDRLFGQFSGELLALQREHGPAAIQLLDASSEQQFHYPVLQYPAKITSLNLDKTPQVRGRLMGLKGQYLLLDSGVINLRKYTSYQVAFSA